jgi:hypothetical protein
MRRCPYWISRRSKEQAGLDRGLALGSTREISA